MGNGAYIELLKILDLLLRGFLQSFAKPTKNQILINILNYIRTLQHIFLFHVSESYINGYIILNTDWLTKLLKSTKLIDHHACICIQNKLNSFLHIHL